MNKQLNKAPMKVTVTVPKGYTMQDKTEYNCVAKADFTNDEMSILIPEEHEATRVNPLGGAHAVKNPIVFDSKEIRFRQQPGEWQRGTIVLAKDLDLDDVNVRKRLVGDFNNALKSIAARRRM